MTAGPDEPTHGREYPSLENSRPPVDPYAPVDYPSDSIVPPNYGPPPGYPQSGYPPPGYPPQYPGSYGYGYDPYAPQRPPGTNGKAIAALVTSLGGMFCGLPSIVGVILGIIAMRETKQTGQDGHGMALAAVIVGALIVAAWLLYVAVIVFAIAVTSTSPSGY